jgi:hypothetical protein
MLDDGQKPKKRSLSEISHLFLSSVRDRQTDGAQPPRRMPPNRTDETIDLTPEEFAQVYGNQPAAEPRRKPVPISAVIGAHLNGKQFDRVKQYARHRASAGGRVGLIELDASELRLMCFDSMGHVDALQTDLAPECGEPRQMAEAMEEMNWDVEHWIVLLPNPRTPEARTILREIDHWILLSTCDHDGVVSSYRMLKGLVESNRPRLTLSVLDAHDEAQSSRVYQKLSSVCQQFLDWPLESESPVQDADEVCEHLVLLYRPTRDKAQMANAPHWAVVSQFVADAKAAQEGPAPLAAEEEAVMGQTSTIEQPQTAATEPLPSQPLDLGEPSRAAASPTMGRPNPGALSVTPSTRTSSPEPADAHPARSENHHSGIDDVIDLPSQDASGQSILSAVIKKAAGSLIECPLRPPMCVEARIAVDRDRTLVLLVVASQGLGELRSISSAYRWLRENRELIGMALPQFSIDPRQSPRLRLLVDRADLTAEALQAMLGSDHVSVQAYRKLRWGERLGVFLEAA